MLTYYLPVPLVGEELFPCLFAEYMHGKVASVDHGPATNEATLVVQRQQCWGIGSEELWLQLRMILYGYRGIRLPFS